MYPRPSYSVPPSYKMPYEYYSSSKTPPPGHGYYSPRYSGYTTGPPPRTSSQKHSRRATQDYSYSSPGVSTYYVYPEYHTSSSYAKKPDNVSSSERPRKGRPANGPGRRASTTARTYYVYDDYHVGSEEYLPAYERDPRKHTPPPPYSREHDADDYAYYQYSTPQKESYQSRPRRASYTTKPQSAPPPKPRQQPPPKRTTATDRDARAAGIPAGYSFKNWDPNEEPILLLGSVFDANSLGKWIYDWTVAFHGPGTPITEVAGDLWLLLIQLAGKIKRAEECLPRVRHRDDRELIDDFLESGERLWQRFNKLLKVCESYMLKTAKRERGSDKLYMTNKSGCEFVDAIFGRDRELERTEKLMTGIRLWGMRFDANCEDVLRSSR